MKALYRLPLTRSEWPAWLALWRIVIACAIRLDGREDLPTPIQVLIVQILAEAEVVEADYRRLS